MQDWLNWLIRIAQTSKRDRMSPRPEAFPIDRTEVGRIVSLLVRGGFARFSEMEARVREGQEAPLTADDERWVESEIRRQLKSKRREEDAWPEETSWDRLNAAFKSLRRKGVIALHCAGYTESDGLSLVDEECATSSPRARKGFCFYHEQDVEAGLAYGGLHLSYGAFEASAEAMHAVPELILRKMRDVGIEASWSGDFDERIHLPGFVWQKRSPRTTRMAPGS